MKIEVLLLLTRNFNLSWSPSTGTYWLVSHYQEILRRGA
ncbi:unnamed protein product [Amoebophrya sp. A25]|nr:unnamed protein product [Amoebophrya sp. A25]|eukprot:GSA25T00025747001.1